jgi:ribosome-associated translation inhibitor RaiA
MRLEIGSRGLILDETLRNRATRRLGFALDRFADRLGLIRVQLSDANGPRGGVDAHCRIVAELVPGGRVVVEDRATDPEAAVSGAVGRIHRAIARTLERRRRR